MCTICPSEQWNSVEFTAFLCKPLGDAQGAFNLETPLQHMLWAPSVAARLVHLRSLKTAVSKAHSVRPAASGGSGANFTASACAKQR